MEGAQKKQQRVHVHHVHQTPVKKTMTRHKYKGDIDKAAALLPNPEDDGPSAIGNKVSATDVAWEESFDKQFLFHGNWFDPIARGPIADEIKSFIHKNLNLAREEGYKKGFDAGGKTVGGTGRVMYQQGYEDGRKEVLEEAGKKLDCMKYYSFSVDDFLSAENVRGCASLAYISAWEKAMQTFRASLEALSNKQK